MSSLRNIEAIGKMLEGTHKFQSKTTVGLSDLDKQAEKNRKREVGEVWIETDPITGIEYRWEQKKGYRRKSTVAGHEVSSINLSVFNKCQPDCEKSAKKLYSHGDYKVGKRTGMCIDCLAAYETKLRYQGKEVFEQYARDKMRANAEAFFAQADKEVEILKQQIINPASYVTADGEVEKWSGWNGDGSEELLQKIEQDYEKLKQQIYNSLSHDNNQSGTE